MQFLASILAVTLFAATCGAQVTAFTNASQWEAAVGPYTTITFDDYPVFTTITDQYAEFGIEFTDGNDHIGVVTLPPPVHQSLVSTDGFGNLGRIHMSFAEPQYWLAFDFIGRLRVEFYSHGELIFTSNNYIAGFTPFVGFVSTVPFDSVVALDYADPTVAIDNLYFGPPIPAPGALALLVGGVAIARRRRRRRHERQPTQSPQASAVSGGAQSFRHAVSCISGLPDGCLLEKGF